MRCLAGLFATASAVVLAPDAIAGTKISLKTALDNALAEGCLGRSDPMARGPSGLLSASEFVVGNPVSTISNLTTTFTYEGQVFDGNVNALVTRPIFEGAFVDEDGEPLEAGSSPYANQWRAGGTPPIVVTATAQNGAAPAVDISVTLGFPRVLVDAAGDPILSGGNLQPDTNVSNCNAGFASGNICDSQVNGSPFPGYLPQVTNPSFASDPTLSRFVDAQRLNVVVTPSFTQTTTASRQVRDGILSAGLSRLCGSQLRSIDNITGNPVTVAFDFNDSAGNRIGAAPAITIPPGGGTPSIGSASGVGQSANRAQDAIVRRESGMNAMVERLKRKANRRKRGEPIAIASNDPSFVPSFDKTPSTTFVTDLGGGIVNIDRSRTELEAGFDAETVLVNAGAALVFHSPFADGDEVLAGFVASFDETDSVTEAATAAERSRSQANSWTAAAYLSWTSAPLILGFEEPGAISVAVSGLYGEGDQSYDRSFTATYTAQQTVTNGVPSATPTTMTDELTGRSDQSFNSATIQLAVSQPIGPLTLTPRASFSSVKFETGGYAEDYRAAAGGALALRYAPVSDEWNETRVGGTATLRTFANASMAIDVGVGVDTVYIGDAATPERVAFFAEDLRATPFAIRYNVDDLDDQYFDLSASVTATFGNGLEAHINGFSRQGHDYLDISGALIGLRLKL